MLLAMTTARLGARDRSYSALSLFGGFGPVRPLIADVSSGSTAKRPAEPDCRLAPLSCGSPGR